MEKLVAIRNAYLVQVKGELAAAQKLAGRQAPAGEAQDRLNLLRELAGEFRQTQTAIEEEEEDPEAIATIYDYEEEFDMAYYGALDILERYVKANKPAKSGFPGSGSKQVDDSGVLGEAMRLILEMQRAMMGAQLAADFEDNFKRVHQALSPEVIKAEVTQNAAIGKNELESETKLKGENGAGVTTTAVEVSPDTLRGIDGNLPQAQILEDFDLEAPATAGDKREQEEISELKQLSPPDQTATELTRNRIEPFIVQQPVGDSKATSDKELNKLESDIISSGDDAFTAEDMLRQQMPTRSSKQDKAQQVRNVKKQVLKIRMGTGLCVPKWIRIISVPVVFPITMNRQNKWQIMHNPSIELKIGWRSKQLVNQQLEPERRLVESIEKDKPPWKQLTTALNWNSTAEETKPDCYPDGREGIWIEDLSDGKGWTARNGGSPDGDVLAGFDEVLTDGGETAGIDWCHPEAASEGGLRTTSDQCSKRIEAQVPQGGGGCSGQETPLSPLSMRTPAHLTVRLRTTGGKV